MNLGLYFSLVVMFGIVKEITSTIYKTKKSLSIK